MRHVLHEDVHVELLEEDDGGERDEDGDELADADAAAHKEGVEPDDAACHDDGGQVVARAEDGEEVRQGAAQERGEADGAQDGGDPVAPRAVEAQKIAEAGGGVAVDAALELGLKARQREKRHDQAQHAHGRDAPGRQDGGAVGTMGGLIARQREHAGAENQRDDRRY